jgi:hypothetical protein
VGATRSYHSCSIREGIPATRRERIEAAVVAGGRGVSAPLEAWLSTDPAGRVRVLITGQYGFERRVVFALAEKMSVITDMVRRTLEDDVD